jgi:hypothetical protein
MSGKVPIVAAADTITNSTLLSINFLLMENDVSDSADFSRGRQPDTTGVIMRIEATAENESWKDTSNRDTGEHKRIMRAAHARVFRRSLSLPRKRARRNRRIIMVALTVEIPNPAMNAYEMMGIIDKSADVFARSTRKSRDSDCFRIVLKARKAKNAMIPICSPEIAST